MRCINRLILSSLSVLVSQCEPKQKPSDTRAYPTPIFIDNALIKTKIDSFIASHDTTNNLFVIWVNNRKKLYTNIIITTQVPTNYPCYFTTGYLVPVALNLDNCGGDTILYQHPAEVTRRLVASHFPADTTYDLPFLSFRVPGHAAIQDGKLLFK
jgi:hypothetical protein